MKDAGLIPCLGRGMSLCSSHLNERPDCQRLATEKSLIWLPTNRRSGGQDVHLRSKQQPLVPMTCTSEVLLSYQQHHPTSCLDVSLQIWELETQSFAHAKYGSTMLNHTLEIGNETRTIYEHVFWLVPRVGAKHMHMPLLRWHSCITQRKELAGVEGPFDTRTRTVPVRSTSVSFF